MANIREITLNILIEYDRDGVRKPSLLKDSLNKYDYLETRDKAFIKRVVDGCIERQIQLDHVLDLFSKTKTDKMQPFIRSLLRMSVYQILFMDGVPESAAVNEAVKLAKKHKFAGLSGFVNGVLRSVARNRDKIEYPSKEENGGTGYLSVLYSMPEWICEMWIKTYGFEKTEKMLQFFLKPRPTTVRLNLLKFSEKEREKDIGDFISELEKCGVEVKRNTVLPYALELEKTDNIRFLPGFEEGKFFPMDVSSMLVTEIADPKPGQTVTDVCAAPGGKSLHAAERVYIEADGNERRTELTAEEADGIVFSRDVSERKCDLITENAGRMGLDNVNVELHDARIHDQNLENRSDILFMDLPCSGLGIIGRKNDIKYNASKQGMDSLSSLQWEIIKASWDYVKPGGILMYSTCTVNRKENEEMAQKICSELPFEPVDITDRLPAALKMGGADSTVMDTATKGYIQILPGEFGTDGFFIAKMRRKTQ